MSKVATYMTLELKLSICVQEIADYLDVENKTY